jgi:hypothetical protein
MINPVNVSLLAVVWCILCVGCNQSKVKQSSIEVQSAKPEPRSNGRELDVPPDSMLYGNLQIRDQHDGQLLSLRAAHHQLIVFDSKDSAVHAIYYGDVDGIDTMYALTDKVAFAVYFLHSSTDTRIGHVVSIGGDTVYNRLSLNVVSRYKGSSRSGLDYTATIKTLESPHRLLITENFWQHDRDTPVERWTNRVTATFDSTLGIYKDGEVELKSAKIHAAIPAVNVSGTFPAVRARWTHYVYVNGTWYRFDSTGNSLYSMTN